MRERYPAVVAFVQINLGECPVRLRERIYLNVVLFRQDIKQSNADPLTASALSESMHASEFRAYFSTFRVSTNPRLLALRRLRFTVQAPSVLLNAGENVDRPCAYYVVITSSAQLYAT